VNPRHEPVNKSK